MTLYAPIRRYFIELVLFFTTLSLSTQLVVLFFTRLLL